MPEHTKGTCVILGARDPGPMDIPTDAYLIVCDGGCRYLGELKPDLIVGDFDSLGYVPKADCPVVQLPVEKDDTDIMAALRIGLERGYDDFILYGCMGGRPDHAYANYQVLGWLTRHGARGCLKGEGWNITHIENAAITLHGIPGTVFSVFAPEGRAEGVSIRDARYVLTDYDMTGAFPIGVSNEFVEDGPATVSVEHGCLLIMWEDFKRKDRKSI